MNEYTLMYILLLTIFMCYYYFKLYRLIKFYKQFPSPPGSLFLGNAMDLKTTSCKILIIYLYKQLLIVAHLKIFEEYTKKYGTMVHLKIGLFEHMLLCSNPKFLEFLLTSNKLLKKSPNLRYLEPWIGTGVATACGNIKDKFLVYFKCV